MLTEVLDEFQNTFSVVPAPAALARLLAANILGGLIGLGCGAGQMPLAAMTTAIVLLVLTLLRLLERKLGWGERED
ncbi:hypothetical protein [Salipiger sp. PrR002]|uniref:hypothetical protein n=1 Tax=unclassified Salipiger TaxID=2640570 RepID=UPI0013B98727|nr:hypothetical protein [Salipiger sp. PrR002]NDW02710.1 hypothetical protein [Salipiger sp. PrR002]NDW59968.1 hypothetical protein [Salipiger sp. PrR004]